MQQVPKQQRGNNEKLSEILADLRIFKHIRSICVRQNKYSPTNFMQLKQSLKNHNKKFKKQEGRQQLSTVWMKTMNINMDRIYEEFDHRKRLTENLLNQKQQPLDSLSKKKKNIVLTEKPFNFPKMTLQNQDKFTRLQHQFIIHDIVAKSITQIAQYDNQFIARVDARWTNQYYDSGEINQKSRLENSSQDYPHLMREYFKIVKSAVDSCEYDCILKGLLEMSHGSTQQKYWRILSQQIRSDPECPQQNSIYAIMLNSLKLLQQQIAKNLSADLQKLDTSIGHQGFGVAYTFYKAGNKQQFFKIISNKNMRKMLSSFIQYERKVQQEKLGEKETWFEYEDISEESVDFYYEQLMYIMQGQKRVSNEKICNPWTLDFAWIVLRIYGLYLTQNKNSSATIGKSELKKIGEYRHFLEGIAEGYKRNSKELKPQVLSNIFYLSDYPTLVDLFESHKNDLVYLTHLDQPFYLHLLMVLYYSPHPLMQLAPYEDFQTKKIPQALALRISSYVIDLMSTNNQQFLYKNDPLMPAYYILMIPLDKWTKTVPRIFKNVQTFRAFDLSGAWEFIHQKISEFQTEYICGFEIFQDCIRQTLRRLIQTTKDEKQILQIASYFEKVGFNSIQKLQIQMALLINKTCQIDVNENSLKGLKAQGGVFYDSLQNQIYQDFKSNRLHQCQNDYQLLMEFIQIFNEIRILSRKGLKKQAHEIIHYKCKDYVTFKNKSNNYQQQQALTERFKQLIQITHYLMRKCQFPAIQKAQEFAHIDQPEDNDENVRLITMFLRMVNAVETQYFYSQGVSTIEVKHRVKTLGKLLREYVKSLL